MSHQLSCKGHRRRRNTQSICLERSGHGAPPHRRDPAPRRRTRSRRRPPGHLGLNLMSRLSGRAGSRCPALLGQGLRRCFQPPLRIPNVRDLFARGALAASCPSMPSVAAWGPRRGGSYLQGLTLPGELGADCRVVLPVPGPDPGPADQVRKAGMTVMLHRTAALPAHRPSGRGHGMLNAEERYGPPALAPSLFNLVTIVWAILGRMRMGLATGYSVGGGHALGGWPVPRAGAARGARDGGSPRVAPSDPGIRPSRAMARPPGLAAVQVNSFVSTILVPRAGAVYWRTILPSSTCHRVLASRWDHCHNGPGPPCRRRRLGMRDTLRHALRMLAFSRCRQRGLDRLGVPSSQLREGQLQRARHAAHGRARHSRVGSWLHRGEGAGQAVFRGAARIPTMASASRWKPTARDLTPTRGGLPRGGGNELGALVNAMWC